MIRISSRDKVHVKHENWAMDYYPDGNYIIFKNEKPYAKDGRYDSVIAKSYNDMSKDKKNENLKRDLISWVEKAINKKVTD